MGLSRRQFTKEFKLAAVRRLEEGISIAEVARGLEVNPNVLQRWRREFRSGPGNVFPGNGNSVGRRAALRNWNDRGSQYATGDYTDLLSTMASKSVCPAKETLGTMLPVSRS